jgi:hypothetical protein
MFNMHGTTFLGRWRSCIYVILRHSDLQLLDVKTWIRKWFSRGNISMDKETKWMIKNRSWTQFLPSELSQNFICYLDFDRHIFVQRCCQKRGRDILPFFLFFVTLLAFGSRILFDCENRDIPPSSHLRWGPIPPALWRKHMYCPQAYTTSITAICSKLTLRLEANLRVEVTWQLYNVMNYFTF